MLTNLLIVDNFKSNLSNEIKKEYNKLINLIIKASTDLYEQKILDGTAGKVSIADIISYQIGWGKLLIYWYESGVNNQMPIMPGEGFIKWDYNAIAKHFYKKYKYNDIQEQIQNFHNVVLKLINITEVEFEKNNLDSIGIWPWCTLNSGKQWPLSKWIKINSASAYKRASSLLNKLNKIKNQKN